MLALTGPLYMLGIYDAVLPSRNVSLLTALTLAMLGLYTASGLLDCLRLRLMGRMAERVDRSLGARVFAVQQTLPLKTRTRGDGLQPMRDLDQLRAFLASPGPTALFDLPWIPLYLSAIFLMHALLGLLATAGALVLLGLMLVAEARSTAPIAAATRSGARRWALAAAARRNAEAVHAMGLEGNLKRRWLGLNARHRRDHLRAGRLANRIGAAIKVARPALQSAMLGLGAYLAIHDQASPGTMIAASIVLSRALAPVEAAIAHWRGLVAARQAHGRLAALLDAHPPAEARAPPPPAPRRALCVSGLSVLPPGARAPVLHDVSFALQAGSALGVVGPSASGKSTLARALVGVWQPHAGCVRLDGRALTQWTPEAFGPHVGYLPQDVALIEGAVADNIARFERSPSEAAVIAAARTAGVHAMIERLPDGYRTHIGEGGMALSAGQRQRIALARALYGRPFLVVLDEPNANLDTEGERDLTAAIAAVRRRGGMVVVIAHRHAALAAVDTVLALAGGRVKAMGPRDAVLAQVLMPGPRRVAAAE